MSKNSFVSVIITLYNKEKYIEKCLRSIQSQTYTNFEVLIINDGSTDNSLQVSKQVIAKDNRFKVITQKNAGLSVARNHGIDLAKGENVVFIDGDDYLKENFLLNLIKFQSYDLVISGFYESLNDKPIKYCNPEEQVVKKIDFKDYIFNSNHYYYCVLAWNKLFKMSIIRNNNLKYEDIVIGEDATFVFNYLKCCENFKVISNSDYCNVIIPNTLSRKRVPRLWENNLEVVGKAEKAFELTKFEYSFLIMRSIKVTLGARCYDYLDFKKTVGLIRKSNEYKQVRLNYIKEAPNKVIYLGIKFKLSKLLQTMFKQRVKKHL